MPCPPEQQARRGGAGAFCDVAPPRHFGFCTFPWEVPAQRPREREAPRKRGGAPQAPLVEHESRS